MKKMDIGIPVGYMTLCGNIANKAMLGFWYRDADVSMALEDVSIPILVINSKADTITPYLMGIDIYEGIQSDNKYIWTVEDSEHTAMWLDHNQEYIDKVSELLELSELQ